MRATGIVRRIDDLGRVVIPKEVRRTMGLREGDGLEIFVDKENIVLSKYRPKHYADIISIADRFVDEDIYDNSETKARRIEITNKLRELAKEMKKLEED